MSTAQPTLKDRRKEFIEEIALLDDKVAFLRLALENCQKVINTAWACNHADELDDTSLLIGQVNITIQDITVCTASLRNLRDMAREARADIQNKKDA